MPHPHELAAQVKAAPDVELPVLEHWNYDPCPRHETNVAGCRHCGLLFRKHQRKGVAWSYCVKRGLICDPVGTGKTAQIGGLLALLKQRGELSTQARAVIVVKPQAYKQWVRNMGRMLPLLYTIGAEGPVRERQLRYAQPWEVLVIPASILISGPRNGQSDYERLVHNLPLKHVFIDDVDAMRHPETQTAYAIKQLTARADRVIFCTATPLQKRLHELYHILVPLGARDVLGPFASFERRYVRKEKVIYYDHRIHRKREREEVVGYKNMEEFVKLIQPFVLRRAEEDIDDVTLPTIIPNLVERELYPRQQAAYDALSKKVKKLLREEGPSVSQTTAMSNMHTGSRICGGLASIGEPDDPETAWKLDWLEQALEGWDDKVVVFCGYKSTIRVLQARLDASKVGYVTIWGDEPDKDLRERRILQFWDDPDTKVLIGTQAIEQSLDIQCAKHLVNVDRILNPQRETQKAGRLRRDGSWHEHIYVHDLVSIATQEERYTTLLINESALADYVWGETNELYPPLHPQQLLQLIAP